MPPAGAKTAPRLAKYGSRSYDCLGGRQEKNVTPKQRKSKDGALKKFPTCLKTFLVSSRAIIALFEISFLRLFPSFFCLTHSFGVLMASCHSIDCYFGRMPLFRSRVNLIPITMFLELFSPLNKS